MFALLGFLVFEFLVGRGEDTLGGGVETFCCTMGAVDSGGVGRAGAEGVGGPSWRTSTLVRKSN